ncbi:MAG: PAS domain S-box protein [Candidatus Thermoplasmatota archaeon]|nr:PAS domain S-box protein [Candidatus Thermoplasmatota archaeon]
MRVLVVDDPIANLSPLEEELTQRGFEATRTWDASEAGNKFSKEPYDAVIASSLCAPLDAAIFCLDCKQTAKKPLAIAIFAPYPISAEDERYLIDVGVDYVFRSTSDKGIVEFLTEFQNNGSVIQRQVKDTYDTKRLMAIARSSYEAAVRDLASRARKLEEILENSSDVIYELDPYGKIILISKVIEKLTGYSREELLGMSALDVTSSDSLEVVADHIAMLLSGQSDPPAVEVGVQSKDGRVIPAEMIVRPIRHENQVVGILGIGRNIEERKRLEANLLRVITEKDFYLDLMSHDLQNFNQAIMGYLEMIMSMENLDPKLERYAKGALRQVLATSQLIAHLKKIAQIRQEGKRPHVKRDLKEILLRSIMNQQSRLDKSNVAFWFEPPPGEFPISASEDMNDLVDLLVSSMVRYSVSDLIQLRISLSSETRNGDKYWVIEISGKNLRLSEPVVKCMIAEDFAGCQMIERPDLQLLVVRAIVETHEGAIETRTLENGRGDGFVIRLPQAK